MNTFSKAKSPSSRHHPRFPPPPNHCSSQKVYSTRENFVGRKTGIVKLSYINSGSIAARLASRLYSRMQESIIASICHDSVPLSRGIRKDFFGSTKKIRGSDWGNYGARKPLAEQGSRSSTKLVWSPQLTAVILAPIHLTGSESWWNFDSWVIRGSDRPARITEVASFASSPTSSCCCSFLSSLHKDVLDSYSMIIFYSIHHVTRLAEWL